MRFELVVVPLAIAAAACSGQNETPSPGKAEPAVALVPGDGGVSSTAVVTPPGVDPSSMHLDQFDTQRPAQPQAPHARERRPIDITLRSTPPGAFVRVDGAAIGTTPAFWSGYADGREHQFVFTLPGHAVAHYRFVPVSSGVIHARLDPIAPIVQRPPDAGVPQAPQVVPTPAPSKPEPPAPSRPVPPAPPPTVVTPAADAAAPIVPAPTEAPPAPSPTEPVPGTGPQP